MGVDSSSYSVGYIQGWAAQLVTDERSIVDVFTQTAARVIECASTLIDQLTLTTTI